MEVKLKDNIFGPHVKHTQYLNIFQFTTQIGF